MASAFSKLEEVQLYFTRLTSDQVAALMEQIDQGDSRLKRLGLRGLLQTEGERTQPLNLKPLVKLEEVELSNIFLTQQELIDFFEAMSPSTKLKKLSIVDFFRRTKHEQMDGGITEVVARGINFLEDVVISVPPYQLSNLHLHLGKFK